MSKDSVFLQCAWATYSYNKLLWGTSFWSSWSQIETLQTSSCPKSSYNSKRNYQVITRLVACVTAGTKLTAKSLRLKIPKVWHTNLELLLCFCSTFTIYSNTTKSSSFLLLSLINKRNHQENFATMKSTQAWLLLDSITLGISIRTTLWFLSFLILLFTMSTYLQWFTGHGNKNTDEARQGMQWSFGNRTHTNKHVGGI